MTAAGGEDVLKAQTTMWVSESMFCYRILYTNGFFEKYTTRSKKWDQLRKAREDRWVCVTQL
mgnify:FL=1